MNAQEARDILLKKFDKMSGNYLYQNADNIDYEQALWNGGQALEKQIPNKPIGDLHSVPHYRCPMCKNSVKCYEDSITYPYCHHCGQALDWSDTK